MWLKKAQLQKLHSPPRNPKAGNKLPVLFLKKPLCTGDLLPMCKIFIERPVLNVNQSGFQPGDSCEYQVLSIVHNVYAGFDLNPPLEVCSCFLDIAKAFDKVWHEGLIYKMEAMGFTGSILRLLQSFLSNRYQRVTINGQTSDWLPILAGVPQ